MLRTVFVAAVALGLAVLMGTPAGAIVNGAPDAGQHPYVAFIYSDAESCSGSAISSTIVLTAAHCLSQRSGERFTVQFTERYADSTPADRTGATAMSLVDFCKFTNTCKNGLKFFAEPDVAVLVLDHAVSLPRYARLPSAGLVDTLPAKQTVTLAGYGAQGVLHPRDPILIGTRLTASGIISTRNYVLRDTILAVTLQGRTNLCFGDSGSPVLVGDTILGVFSFLNGQCSTAGFAYRIDQPDVLAALASIH